MVNQNRIDNSFTQRLNEIIEANMSDEGFGVSELAREMNMSRTNLYRRIKTAKGISVSQFIMNTRLDKALEILQKDSLTVSETAYSVGFRSASYFSRCFTRYFGYPPVEAKGRTLDVTDQKKLDENDDGEESQPLLKNFLVQTTSFIRREKEIQTIAGLINEYRIVTLTGTGGCGKTRLACEVVPQLVRDYPDGIWFVDLATIEVEELVVRQLMTSLGLSEIPGKEMLDVVVEKIQDKKLLILLDNCEHLLRTCAEISSRLIESIPGLTLLITSRESLKIKGEKVWGVPSLSLADPSSDVNLEQAAKSEAVCLFTDRARLTNSGFELVESNANTVSRICHQLDGIPLAIELVASRTRHMDTLTMLDRLTELFDSIPSLDHGTSERHRTIQAAIEWSYNLLSEEEKVLFRRLSVFTGGFDLKAVENSCTSEHLPLDRILDLLSQLVDRSMIQTVYQQGHQMRYRLLETLQGYAAKLLVEEGEELEIKRRHVEYFSRMAEEAYEERVSKPEKWLIVLQKEHENMLAALSWADLHDPAHHCILAGSLSWFWLKNGHYTTARKFLEKVYSGNTGNNKAHARVITGLGILLSTGGDLKRALKLLNQALLLWRDLRNRKEEALVLTELTYAKMYTGKDDDDAVELAKEAFSLAKQLDDPGIEFHCMCAVAQSLVMLKNTTEARPAAERLLVVAQQLEIPFGIYGAYHLLGDCAIMEEQYNESEREYGRSLISAYKSGDTFQTCIEMAGLAMAVAGQGRYAKALRLNSTASRISKELGAVTPENGDVIFWRELIEKHIIETRKKIGETLTLKYEEQGRAFSLEDAVDYALDFGKD